MFAIWLDLKQILSRLSSKFAVCSPIHLYKIVFPSPKALGSLRFGLDAVLSSEAYSNVEWLIMATVILEICENYKKRLFLDQT